MMYEAKTYADAKKKASAWVKAGYSDVFIRTGAIGRTQGKQLVFASMRKK